VSEFLAALLAKTGGAVVGAILALVFVPPRTRWGFVRRLTAALIIGPVFAVHVRDWADFSRNLEGTFGAACLVAFASWWLMGAVKRAAEALSQERENRDPESD